MSTTQSNRILSVEIRAARIGYAVFETATPCDFGAAWYESPTEARSRIARLLGLCRPSVLVLCGRRARYPLNVRTRRAAARIARDEARKFAIQVARVTEQEFDSFFERHSCRNKYNRASLLAEWFPEIAWRLPQRPKFYEPEPRAMLYFDSIALGVAYLQNSRAERQM